MSGNSFKLLHIIIQLKTIYIPHSLICSRLGKRHFTNSFDVSQVKLYIYRFCSFNFCKFAIFFADSKSRAQGLSNDVSFVIFGHQTWDLEGEGGQIDPSPPAYPGFQVPQQG